MISRSMTFTYRLKFVYLKEHFNLAWMYLLTATMAKDAKMRTLFFPPYFLTHFLSYTDSSYQAERLKWKDDQTWLWNLDGEYIIFSLCCKTHRQSLAKDNTCIHKSAPRICVCVHTCMDLHTTQGSTALLFLIRKAFAKWTGCLQSVALLPAWKLLFPVLVKNRRHKERISVKAILLTFCNRLLVMCICRCLKVVISC